ncbi:hypothetical protein EB796_001076 [Bugula neritina]|uniref:N-acetylglucosamine-6-phosphate deacetylase n=1 Tax=Bugula neritina TaxID=10212 RepID=A0A7J7KRF4_BUGNE|nr:hypothetical protein EB796_001076 [Bugula neritina]
MATQSGKDIVYKFYNCRILKNHKIYWDDLWVRDGTILDPQKCFYGEVINPDVKVDCGERLIAAGYIETQINGAYGVDFSDSHAADLHDVERGIMKVAKGLLSHGVTSFCPTLVTSPPAFYQRVVPHIKKREGNSDGAGILGIHLEGPFISKEKKGAHPEQFIVSDLTNGSSSQPSHALEEVYGNEFYSNTAIITMAPELPGALDVIRQLTNMKDIRVSIGHSVGTIKDGEKAVLAGANYITHLFNAMLPFHHRDPGLVGLLTSWKLPKDTEIYYGIIADGIHTHPATMRIAHRTNPNGIILVSDSMCAAGLDTGNYSIGQLSVEVKENKAVLSGTNTLAGSIAFLDQCVRKFYKDTECSLVEAIEAATLHPARLLKIQDRKGTLDFGSDADFIILDDELNIMSTYIAGECVYSGG